MTPEISSVLAFLEISFKIFMEFTFQSLFSCEIEIII